MPLTALGLDDASTPVPSGRSRPDPCADRLAGALGEVMAEMPTFCLLDLPPVLGVRVAARLAATGHVRPALNLARWPYAQAVLPAARLVAALCAEVRRLPSDPGGAGLALVLDGERNRPLQGRLVRDARADNRYETAPEELPDAAALLHAGIERVLDIRLIGQRPPRSFVLDAYGRYVAAGLRVRTRSVATDGSLVPLVGKA